MRVEHGDCLDVMRRLADEGVQVDAVVTDPPYELNFMLRSWDATGIANRRETWELAYALLKPGGHLVAFGGTRTAHRMVCAIEDAGFEVRDSLCWLYGTGFPKSLDVSKAIDKAAGAERAVIGMNPHARPSDGQKFVNMGTKGHDPYITAPATDAARQWEGWGTALKPAHEPICLARKPLAEPTVAAQVPATGTGALHIDACRIGINPAERDIIDNRSGAGFGTGNSLGAAIGRAEGAMFKSHAAGRWPANVLHDGSPEVLEAFAAFGERTTPNGRPNCAGKPYGQRRSIYSSGRDERPFMGGYLDTGTAARFFYSAKASKADRAGSKHPTVKPVALMRWLCRLVTPPGGVILDPFAGSGTTGQAAAEEGFDAILIEREAEYVADIHNRLSRDLFAGAA